MIQKANDCMRYGKYPQAIAILDKALLLDPNNRLANERKVQCMTGVASKTSVSTTSGKQPSLPPRVGQRPYAQAHYALEETRNLDQAEKLFRLAIEKRDNTESAIKDLAQLLQRQGRYEEAATLLKEFVNQATDRLRILNLLSNIYQHADQYADALGVLQQILEIAPTNRRANVMKQLGYCQLKLERFSQAEDTLLEVLKLAPQDATARIG